MEKCIGENKKLNMDTFFNKKKKSILLFSKDVLKCSKVTLTKDMLQQIYISK